MNAAVPTPPEKEKLWYWILGAAVLFFLCEALVVVMAVGYFFFRKGGTISLPGLFQPTPTQTPARATPVPTRTLPGGLLTVQPYDPSSGIDITLQNLALGWDGSTTPDEHTWQIQVSASDPAIIYMGWCTIDQATLSDNYMHLTWTAEVDGRKIPSGSFTMNEYIDSEGRACRDYAGVIMTWTAGPHRIVTTMHLDQDINDGWDTYPAGDYVDIYQITVVR